MPNTLAHLGIQGVATRSLVRSAEVKWIFLGCLIPDFPWILQRVVRAFAPGIHPYDLRLYSIVQASLLSCFILSGALALSSEKPGRVFAILSLNSTFHLLLDACQIKWGNGIHLFAPFSWELVNFRLFWPESLPTHGLTIFGLGFAGWAWIRGGNTPNDFYRLGGLRFLLIAGLTMTYLFMPFSFQDEAESSDNHFVKTLREREFRPGQPVEFDRAAYVLKEQVGILKIFSGEEFFVTGNIPVNSGTVSIRGWFVDSNKVFINDFHEHPASLRDTASYLGLSLVAAFWLAAPLADFYKKNILVKTPMDLTENSRNK